jgi:hypothetical protein
MYVKEYGDEISEASHMSMKLYDKIPESRLDSVDVILGELLGIREANCIIHMELIKCKDDAKHLHIQEFLRHVS